MRRAQSLNLSMTPSGLVAVTNLGGGLVAGRSGATNDGVLLFVSGSVSITQWGMSLTNDANLGTFITILRPGVYRAELGGSVAAGSSAIVGMSLNQTAGLTGDPSFANAGTLDVLAATAPAGNVAPFFLSTTFVITKSTSQPSGQFGGVLRFLGSDGAGAAPAGLTQAAAYYRVSRIAELY